MLNSISKLVKFISSRFLLFILGIFLATGATYVYATWTSPTLAPPEGNIAALINTSNTGQAKQGGLILNTGGSANGLIVQFGNVGIGTTSPGAKLEVVGNIIADAPTASDHLATKGYVDASGGGGGCFDQYHYPWCTTHQNEKCAKSGTMDYKCIGDFCTKASISNDMDGDGITAATDCDDDDIIIVAAVDNTCDGDADGKIDTTAYTTAPRPALADCYDSDPTKYLCLSNGTACSSSTECASTIRVDEVCCNSTCIGSTCQRCDAYSASGAGICNYVSSSAEDPDNECTAHVTPENVCVADTCSGSGYACGVAPGPCDVCGDSIITPPEVCDDGGISWTSGNCAANCLKINYWSNPTVSANRLFTANINQYCVEKGLVSKVSYNPTTYSQATTGWYSTLSTYFICDATYCYNAWNTEHKGTTNFISIYSGYNYVGSWFLTSVGQTSSSNYIAYSGESQCCQGWTHYYSRFTTEVSYISWIGVGEIWCAD